MSDWGSRTRPKRALCSNHDIITAISLRQPFLLNKLKGRIQEEDMMFGFGDKKKAEQHRLEEQKRLEGIVDARLDIALRKASEELKEGTFIC